MAGFKVMLIHNMAWSHYRGVVFSELYKIFKKNNIEMSVLHVAETSIERSFLGSMDLSSHKYPYKILFKGVFEKTNLIARIFLILKELMRYRPDVLVVSGYNDGSSVIAFVAQKILGGKTVIETDTTFYDRSRTRLKEFIKRVILKVVDMGFPKSSAAADYLKMLGMPGKDLKIIPYIPDNEFIKKIYLELFPLREKIKKGEGIPTRRNFLFVGRFSPEKNVEGLIKSFLSLKLESEKAGDWGLILVGDGKEKGRLRSIAGDSVEKNIYFVGGKSWKEVIKYYLLSDVFVLPSFSEPWGLVVNEAMLCKLPVIVSQRAGAYKDLVREGKNGFGVDPYNMSELRRIMLEFVNNDEILSEMGEESARTITNYTVEMASSGMYEGIVSLLNLKIRE